MAALTDEDAARLLAQREREIFQGHHLQAHGHYAGQPGFYIQKLAEGQRHRLEFNEREKIQIIDTIERGGSNERVRDDLDKIFRDAHDARRTEIMAGFSPEQRAVYEDRCDQLKRGQNIELSARQDHTLAAAIGRSPDGNSGEVRELMQAIRTGHDQIYFPERAVEPIQPYSQDPVQRQAALEAEQQRANAEHGQKQLDAMAERRDALSSEKRLALQFAGKYDTVRQTPTPEQRREAAREETVKHAANRTEQPWQRLQRETDARVAREDERKTAEPGIASAAETPSRDTRDLADYRAKLEERMGAPLSDEKFEKFAAQMEAREARGQNERGNGNDLDPGNERGERGR